MSTSAVTAGQESSEGEAEALVPLEVEAEVDALVPLRRNLRFQTLWAGQAASSLGVSVADVAYPLAILSLTGSPAQAGLFAAILTAGMLVGALPGGQLADRYDRRMIVIVTETARAVVTAAVAAGFIFGWLTLPAMLAAAALLGAGQSVANAARKPLVRSVVPDAQLTTALIQDEVRQQGAQMAGPPLAGVLYAVRALTHAVPFIFTAAMFVLSMISAVAMRALPKASRPDGQAEVGEPAGAEPGGPAEPAATAERAEAAGKGSASMLLGLRALWQNPLLRAAMLLIMAVNTTGAGLDLAIIVILRGEHVRTGLIGTVLAAAAVGALTGALLVKPLHKIRPGILLLGVCLLDIPFTAGMALRYGPLWVASLLFLSSLAVPAIRVLVDVLIFRQTPDEQRGRVVGAVMSLIGLGMPAGMAGTGLLLQWLAPQTAVLVLAGLLAAGVLYCASMRSLWSARWPRQQH